MNTARFTAWVSGMSILECLELALLCRNNIVLMVTSSEGIRGAIYLRDGQVRHAVCQGITGEEAFYRAMSLSRGKFCCLPWRQPPSETISRSTDYLLLEASRRRDEWR